MSAELIQILCFWFFSIVAVLGSLAVISLRHSVHAVLSLVLTFFSVACLWLLLQAEFLAIILVVVYVGAVMVLFLFVVMMLDVDQAKLREGFVRYLPIGVIVAAIMLIEMISLIGVKAMHANPLGPDPALVAETTRHFSEPGNTAWLGMSLYTEYLLPFEIAALILTLGMVAAVTLTLRFRKGVRKQNPSDQARVSPKDRLRIVSMEATRNRSSKHD